MTPAVRQRAKKQPAEIRREEVLDAAVKVFARESFRGAGTAEIAREAGIAEPTIYRHFSSKRELYLRAVERSCDVVRGRFSEIIVQNEAAVEALLAVAAWYRQSIEDDPAHLRLRMRATAEANDDDVRELLSTAFTELVQMIAGLIRRGQEQGAFKKQVSAEGAALLFVGVGQTTDATRLLGMDDADREQCFLQMGWTFWDLLVEPGVSPPEGAIRP